MFFSVITENLNWNILIKNLVSFNRWNGVKDENFNMGVPEKPVCRGDCLKRGGGRKRGGWYPNAHYQIMIIS